MTPAHPIVVALVHLVDPSTTPSPSGSTASPGASCLNDKVCHKIWDLSGLAWLADGSLYLLVKPLHIVLIIVLAAVIRMLLHNAIKRLISTTARTSVAGVLRPLRERMPGTASVGEEPGSTAAVRPASPTYEAGGVVTERRRQRTEAVGSVLRSSVTAIVFAIAALMILDELGVKLGPLLASAGIAGLAIGFGAQTLVKDLIAGLFMLLEDQYGVGDTVDLGEATGVVESVGLRVTTIRDSRGVLWYIRNGEITRVGNSSQGWALVVVDLPIGFASVEEATNVLRTAASVMAEDPGFADDFIEPPTVMGVEQVTVDGTVLRTTARTAHEAQARVARELRRRLAEALEGAGITEHIAARMFPRAASPGDA